MTAVREMLASKGSEVFTIDVAETVFDAVAKMTAKNVGALVVTHREEDQDKVCGIISERDYLRYIVLKGRSSRETPIKEIMAKKVIYGDLDATAEEALNIMTTQRIRHLPIMEGEKLVGLVSIGDCVKAVIKQQAVHLKVLQEYIADSYPGPSGGGR